MESTTARSASVARFGLAGTCLSNASCIRRDVDGYCLSLPLCTGTEHGSRDLGAGAWLIDVSHDDAVCPNLGSLLPHRASHVALVRVHRAAGSVEESDF